MTSEDILSSNLAFYTVIYCNLGRYLSFPFIQLDKNHDHDFFKFYFFYHGFYFG